MQMGSNNSIARAMFVIGVIEISIGAIVFLAMMAISAGATFWLALVVLIVCVISGIMFLGFGEIISLLADISGKLGETQDADPADALPRL